MTTTRTPMYDIDGPVYDDVAQEAFDWGNEQAEDDSPTLAELDRDEYYARSSNPEKDETWSLVEPPYDDDIAFVVPFGF